MTPSVEALELVTRFFDGNEAKAWLWFLTANPLLGNVRPVDFIRMGRSAKVLGFVRDCLAENKPPGGLS